MTPVIRIDSEVLNELKTKAKELDLVFEPPNATLRVILGLDKKMTDNHHLIVHSSDTTGKHQPFGKHHDATPVKDTVTGETYPSKYQAGLAFKSEFPNIDIRYLWYQAIRKYRGRFIEVRTGKIW